MSVESTPSSCPSCAIVADERDRMKRALVQLKRKVTDTATVVSLYATARQDLDAANERIGVLETELVALRKLRDEQARELASLRSHATATQAAATSMQANVVSKARFDELQWQLRAAQHELKQAATRSVEDVKFVKPAAVVVDAAVVAAVAAAPKKRRVTVVVPKPEPVVSTTASTTTTTTTTAVLDELDSLVNDLDDVVVKSEPHLPPEDSAARDLLEKRLTALLALEIVRPRPPVDTGVPTARQMSTSFDRLASSGSTDEQIDSQILVWLRRGVSFESIAVLICARVADGADAEWMLAMVVRGHELLLLAILHQATALLVDGQLTSASAACALLRFALTALVRSNRAPLARMMVLDVLSLRRYFEPQLVDEAMRSCPSLLERDDDNNLSAACAVLLRMWRARVPPTPPTGAAADVQACDAALSRLASVPVQSPRDVALSLVARFFTAIDAGVASQPAAWFAAARACAPAMQPQRVDAVSCVRGDESAQAALRVLTEWSAAALDAACCLLAVCAQGGWLWTWHGVVTDAIWPRLLTRGSESGAAQAATRHHALRLCAHLATIAAGGAKRDIAAPLLHLRTLCASILMPSFQSPLNAPSAAPPLAASVHAILYVPHADANVSSLERALDISGVVGWVEQEAAAHALCTTSFGAAKDLLIVRTWFRALSPTLQQLVPMYLQQRIE